MRDAYKLGLISRVRRWVEIDKECEAAVLAIPSDGGDGLHFQRRRAVVRDALGKKVVASFEAEEAAWKHAGRFVPADYWPRVARQTKEMIDTTLVDYATRLPLRLLGNPHSTLDLRPEGEELRLELRLSVDRLSEIYTLRSHMTSSQPSRAQTAQPVAIAVDPPPPRGLVGFLRDAAESHPLLRAALRNLGPPAVVAVGFVMLIWIVGPSRFYEEIATYAERVAQLVEGLRR